MLSSAPFSVATPVQNDSKKGQSSKRTTARKKADRKTKTFPYTTRKHKKVRYPRYEIDVAKDVKVASIPNKGGCNGLVANVDLPPNARLSYSGKLISQEEYDALCAATHANPKKCKTWAEYIMKSPLKDTYVDAHPRHLKDGNIASQPAAAVNEPAPSERPNMIILKPPGAAFPVLVTVRRIAAGEELLIKYGVGWKRNYLVGESSSVPKPKWL